MNALQKIRNARLVVFTIICMSLLFTLTNLIPLSLTFGVLIILLPALLLGQKTWHPILIITSVLLFYFLCWTLIYSPSAFLDYSFYRRDGNVFATLLPIVLFGAMCFPMDVEKLAEYFVYIVSSINFIAALGYKFFGIGQELAGSCYCFMFLTHNAAGGFLAMLSALSLALWLRNKTTPLLLIVIGNLTTLYMSDSRGSVLALVGAVFMHYVLKERHIKKIMTLVVIITVVTISITYTLWDSYGRDLNYSTADMDSIEQNVQLNFERSYTFVDRVLFLWPRAVYLWLYSPVFGTGFGSYNDLPYNLEGLEHIFMINIPKEYIYSDGHAHHTFFHILAETGLLGFLFTLLFLVTMHRFILSLNSSFLRSSLGLMFWVAVWSSMTEHRLFTPSQMLPFTILLGLTLGNERVKSVVLQNIKALKFPLQQYGFLKQIRGIVRK
ncbi:MAG: O-antigen ligase family protein [Chlamydiales bacterium]|nr:O-antigen ligase family protein [Chlamydiales bacterium]